MNVQVAREFLARIEERAVGQEVLKSVLPAQLIVKIVYDELVRLLGEKESRLVSSPQPPTVHMIVGLQGSGKTTFCAKLARRGIIRLPQEGPLDFALRASRLRPELGTQIIHITTLYVRLRYGRRHGTGLAELRHTVRRFKPRESIRR